jgi:hypothetical protein
MVSDHKTTVFYPFLPFSAQFQGCQTLKWTASLLGKRTPRVTHCLEKIMTAFKPHMPNTKTDNVVCMRYHTRWVQEVGFHTWGLTGREHGDPSTMSPFRILFER